MTRRLGLALCVLAGASDTVTGALLLAAPRMTLDLMRAGDPVSELIWMRYLGAFVLAVGLLHGYGLARRGPRLAPLMEATALLRAVIAAFTGAAVIAGALSTAWLLVTATDGAVALAQIIALRTGAFDHED